MATRSSARVAATNARRQTGNPKAVRCSPSIAEMNKARNGGDTPVQQTAAVIAGSKQSAKRATKVLTGMQKPQTTSSTAPSKVAKTSKSRSQQPRRGVKVRAQRAMQDLTARGEDSQAPNDDEVQPSQTNEDNKGYGDKPVMRYYAEDASVGGEGRVAQQIEGTREGEFSQSLYTAVITRRPFRRK